MQNMKSLSRMVKKIIANIKVNNRQTDRTKSKCPRSFDSLALKHNLKILAVYLYAFIFRDALVQITFVRLQIIVLKNISY